MQCVNDQFADVGKLVEIGSGAEREITDFNRVDFDPFNHTANIGKIVLLTLTIR